LTGFIETLQGHAKDDAEVRNRFLDIMSAQARRMSRLIDDLLSLSRIEMNEHVPPVGACDLVLVVREVADGLLPSIEEKKLQLKINVPAGGEALVGGERNQLTQVVQNLVDNAVKYSPEGADILVALEHDVSFEPESTAADLSGLRDAGGGRLVLLASERGHERRYVRIQVADQGSGIAREHLPRLTERFYRVPGQKSGDVSGTGLGLAIAKHIVNRHRGALMVESAPGRGTTFCAYLPIAEAGNPGDDCHETFAKQSYRSYLPDAG
jgi:two-component system phosphate regulon sensor histidine kinase PhoR